MFILMDLMDAVAVCTSVTATIPWKKRGVAPACSRCQRPPKWQFWEFLKMKKKKEYLSVSFDGNVIKLMKSDGCGVVVVLAVMLAPCWWGTRSDDAVRGYVGGMERREIPSSRAGAGGILIDRGQRLGAGHLLRFS